MHTLVCGTTGTYKTHLVAQIARQLVKRGETVIVFTPITRETRWHAAGVQLVLHDRAQLLAVMKSPATKDCFIIFDEAMVTIGHHDVEMVRFATESRNNGHSCIFICQFAAQFNKGVRRQCENIYCFYQEEDDAKALKKQFSEPALLKAVTLRNGYYIRKRRFEKAAFGRVKP